MDINDDTAAPPRDGGGDTGDGVRDDAEAQLGRLLNTLADPSVTDGLSLARISKRAGLPMSTLRRILTALEDAGIVSVTLSEDGRGSAALTEQGRGLAASLQGGVAG